jgi:6-phosphogluconolactonase
VAVFPVSSDGHLQEASSVMKDEGPLGPNKARQDTAHAHWIETDARNWFAYVADLGLDHVLTYRFDASKGVLKSPDSPAIPFSISAVTAPGTGPRHVAFSSHEYVMYVLGELNSTVTVFVEDDRGTYQSIQKISALPSGFSRPNDAAEIVAHPNGKFLYTSNRGDDSIAVFAIDRASEKLTFVERVSSGGKTPRNFAIDPAGARLLAANQDTGNIVEFSIDKATGRLTPTGEVAKVPSAVCLVFVTQD